jgi:glycosyltransferase involved in cell wall biosynthesis
MVVYSSYPIDPRPRRVIDAFVNQGMTVDLVCIGDKSTPKYETFKGFDIRRVRVTRRRGGKLAYLYEYTSFILISAAILAYRAFKRRYDLVYVHNMPDILVLSALVPKALGARVILDLHDPMPELMMTIYSRNQDSRSVRILKRVEKWSMARADFVLTVNEACKRIFSLRSCPAEKIGVVMNSPIEEIFPFLTERHGASANRNQDKPFTMMYHGFIAERNGLGLAIEALARVRETVPNAELRIYGTSNPFLERVMEEVHNKGLDKNVHYLGPRRLEDVVPEIDACDVGIIPNQRNPFTEINTPTRIFEYLARRKPVIAPRTPGIQDYFDQKSLFFFEPGNAADLAHKIEYVVSHAGEAAEMAERGQSVYSEHAWSQERKVLVKLVSGVLNAK